MNDMHRDVRLYKSSELGQSKGCGCAAGLRGSGATLRLIARRRLFRFICTVGGFLEDNVKMTLSRYSLLMQIPGQLLPLFDTGAQGMRNLDDKS